MNLSKNKYLVSVIIVNWNGKKWLKKCLNSLQNQTFKSIEIVLVDNASSDGSLEYLKKYYPKVNIIKNKENLGYPKAANIGIKKSNGDYLLLINNDAWVDKYFIEKLFNFYSTNSYSVISPVSMKYSGKVAGNMLPSIDPTGSTAYFFPISKKDKLFFLSVCYFCSKNEYLKTQGFDDNHFAYFEDVDWFWRLTLMGKKFNYAEDVFVYHEGAGSTGKGIKYNMFLWRNQNTLQTLLKNYSVATLIIILPIYILQNLMEILFFLTLLKFDIASSYIQGWVFNIKNFNKIMKKRKWIQERRKVSDLEILKKMYLGPAKLKMLLSYKS